MNAEQFECFGLGRTKSRGDITAHLFRKGLPGLPSLSEDDGFKDTIVIGKIATLVHQINLHTIFALLDNIDKKKSNIELERSIKEDWSMDLIEKANEDMQQMLAQEMEDDGDDAPMEKVINDRVKAGITEGLKPTQAELQKLRQQLRAKGTRGGKGQPSEPRSNGQTQSVRFADSSKEKQNSHPATNDSKTKSWKKKKKKKKKEDSGNGNHAASQDEGRKSGSPRS